MNKELIKQLAKQAQKVVGHTDGGYTELKELDPEKFAELIVEECIKLNGKELAMAGHSRMVDVYCEHFGIEL